MGKRQKGYTLVEVLLFLAISGALFTATVSSMSGRQENQRFKQSMETMEFKIRTMFNDVDRGYAAKPNNSVNNNCTSGAPVASATNDAQCVFVGKEMNLCTSSMYVSSRVAPYSKQNYTDTNATINTTYETSQEYFTAPNGIVFLQPSGSTPCRIAALNSTVGTSNQRVPRYSARSGGTWDVISDSNPLVMCFRQGATSGRYATIKINQSDIVLTIGVPSC